MGSVVHICAGGFIGFMTEEAFFTHTLVFYTGCTVAKPKASGVCYEI